MARNQKIGPRELEHRNGQRPAAAVTAGEPLDFARGQRRSSDTRTKPDNQQFSDAQLVEWHDIQAAAVREECQHCRTYDGVYATAWHLTAVGVPSNIVIPHVAAAARRYGLRRDRVLLEIHDGIRHSRPLMEVW